MSRVMTKHMTRINENTGSPLPRITRRNRTKILNKLFSNSDLMKGGRVGPNKEAYNTSNVTTNVDKYLLSNILFNPKSDVMYI